MVSITGKWAYIQNDQISGWVYAESLSGTEQAETSENSENLDNTENIEDNQVVETEEEETTSQVEEGYPKTMYVNVDAVYVRESASTDSQAVASVGLNTPVTVNGEEGDWYKVYVTDGTGYMMKQYLSENRQ